MSEWEIFVKAFSRFLLGSGVVLTVALVAAIFRRLYWEYRRDQELAKSRLLDEEIERFWSEQT